MESEAHVLSAYSAFLEREPSSVCAAAIKALTEDIRRSGATTMMGLRDELRQAGEALNRRADAPISITSLCEIFVRFVTRTALDSPDFESCKRLLIERGEMLAHSASAAHTKIGALGAPFVQSDGVVLTHGYSRMVISVLLEAATSRHFSVIVAESHPQGGGHAMAAELAIAGVPVTMIEDAAVAHTMSRTQMVLCGAEAVVESGGIISRTGTYQMAIVAAAYKKPFYVAAESTKFTRMFPLSQQELPEHQSSREHAAYIGREQPPANVKVEKPSRDYTPPCYITMIFTDLGVLTPSAVSDELIKLFT
uniref:Translation initiation factor eIF2B subunit alpha n=1 Tax=Coccolithus braarudii TaxID=221442 RepID=A0A7S0LEG1_9EUKA|mmetsp:Transcript_36261/g.77332  ORF Transcript_36261/g.77332 Transcript_36261/m.77332 type:complete len:308 (+) Transcript_36261:23-946(+)